MVYVDELVGTYLVIIYLSYLIDMLKSNCTMIDYYSDYLFNVEFSLISVFAIAYSA